MKFALSAVSADGAIKNLQAEIPHWNFGKTRNEAKEKWNKELSKIKVETNTPDEKVVFYTALYHAFISPIIYEDVDGQYRGLDQNIHNLMDLLIIPFFLYGIPTGLCIHYLIWFNLTETMIWSVLCWPILMKVSIPCYPSGRIIPMRIGV